MTTRLCNLPNFNECVVHGETGCCEVVAVATACPVSYTLCEDESNTWGTEALYLQEVRYRFACCPIGFFCLPRPSCVSYVEDQLSVLTITSDVTSTPTLVSVDFSYTTTQNSTIQTVNTASLAGESFAPNPKRCNAQANLELCLTNANTALDQCRQVDNKCKCDSARTALDCYRFCPDDKGKATQESIVISWCETAGGGIPTYLPKLYLGPEQYSEENYPHDGELTHGSLAAVVVVSSLVGGLVIAASIRSWRRYKQRTAALPSHLQEINHKNILDPSQLASKGPNSRPYPARRHVAELAVELQLTNRTEEVLVYNAELSATPAPVELPGEGAITGARYPEIVQIRATETR
ncbi:hypothetical protein BDZ91DRAFT_760766 [Kalaharituber pfeilii]|nr:hypothetical protein BDZ91DRAFT_760766 [Kalaharituber pfeilii]